MTLSKLTFVLFFLMLSLSLSSQSTIPNQDFENWLSTTAPKNWQSTTLLLPPGYITCQRTTNSFNGDYAIKLTTIDLDGWPVPGVITLGEIGIGYSAGGIGFGDRPAALKGQVIHPSSGDQLMVIVQFFKNGVEMGGGFWSTTDSIPEFTEFNMPISFLTAENPDTLNITILTDQNIPGSSMIIDALQFEYTTTTIGSKSDGAAFNIYPNPCSDQLFIQISSAEPFEARVYDLSGKIMVRPDYPGTGKIDTSRLPAGTYIIVAETSTNLYQSKVIKQ